MTERRWRFASRAALASLALAGACGRPPRAAAPVAACPSGPVLLARQADVDAVAGCGALASVTIRTGAGLDLGPLAGLTRIAGDLVVGPSVGLAELALPGLVEVGGKVRAVGNGSLAALSLPALTRATALEIEGDVELRSVALPALAAVAGDLRIARAESLTLVSAPALVRIGGALAIARAPALTALVVPALAAVGGVEIAGSDLDPEQIAALAALAR